MKEAAKWARVFDRIIGFLAFLSGVVIILIITIVVVEVVVRKLAAGWMPGFFWVIEIVEYLLLFGTFLAAAWLLKGENHVKMDLILNWLNPTTQSIINVITSILCSIVCLVIACYGVMSVWDFFQSGYEISTVVRPLKWPLVSVIPLGFFMLFIQFLRRTYGYLQGWRAASGKES